MLKVAVVGASGYTGVELLRLLHCHPEVAVTCITSEQSAGKPVAEVFPSLRARYGQVLENLEPVRVAEKADLVFTALPHKAAMEVVPTFLKLGRRVVDLSADYRFHDAAVYQQWYEPHMNPELLAKAVYGLPEVRRAKIKGAKLVGNPGCYPTSVILGLQPLLAKRLIDTSSIIADSKSGVSGAGRGAKVENLYCEVNDGFRAYGVGGVHRHIPEIEQELSLLAGETITISFTPHLVPMDRGIFSTVYATPRRHLPQPELLELYRAYYAKAPFVRVIDHLPSTKDCAGSNFLDVAVRVVRDRVVVLACEDNLVRGASGVAVQNFNVMAGLDERTALL
jgi:N-acetyl-gamma-glutamyl-phosphate reductase